MKPGHSYAILRAPILDGIAEVDALLRAAAEHGFVAPLPSKESSVGWTHPEDPTKPLDVYAAKLDGGSWLALGIRHDEKKVPSALVKLRLNEACAKWCAEHQRAKVPVSVRQELAETIEHALLLVTPPTPTTAVVLYDTTAGLLYVSSSTGAAAKALPQLWRDSFQAGTLASLSLLDPMLDHLSDEQLDHLSYDKREGGVVSLLPDRAGQFLAYLWWRSESAAEGLPKLCGPEEGTETAWQARAEIVLADGDRKLTVRAADAATDPAVRTALVEGRRVDRLGIQLVLPDSAVVIAEVVLEVKQGDLRVASITLPKQIDADWADKALEWAHAVSDVHERIACMLWAWGTGPGSADNLPQSSASLVKWATVDLVDWMRTHGMDADRGGN